MKKKSCLTLAVLLAMLQIIAVFAVVPASATTMSSKNYNLLKASEAITIDGKADEAVWENADWSDQFVKASNSGGELGDFKAKFKAVWAPVEGDDSKMDIYILIVGEGHTVPTNWANCMRVYIRTSDDSKSFWTGMKKLTDNIINNTKPSHLLYGGSSPTDVNAQMHVYAVNDIANSGTATYEFCYRMDKADSIKFEVSALAAFNGGQISASWCGGDANTGDILGVGTILAVNTNPGASIRIDTSEQNPKSGIRFVSSVDMTRFNAWTTAGAEITTGTLIVPTENLTKKSITGAFDKEALTNSGLVENTHFYDIVNVDNEWVSGNDGTWYATLYNIQDYTREFTAVGYVTVTIGDETTTYYGIPSESRSIAQVAQTLMSGETEGDEGRWTSVQEAVLKSFFTQGAQS